MRKTVKRVFGSFAGCSFLLQDTKKSLTFRFPQNFNIHPAKESEVKIVDWDRTYFLTKYYCI